MKRVILSAVMLAAFSGAAVAAPITIAPSTLTFTGANDFQLGSWGVGNLSNTGTTFTFTVDGYNIVDLSISSSPQSSAISAELYLGNGTSTLLGTAATGSNYTYVTSSYLTNQTFTVKYIGDVNVNANGNVSVTRVVPAPAVLGLVGLGLVGVGFFGSRRRG
jgi:hypothetical protein